MRLINVHDGSFKEFIGRNVPPYAILSHTWEEEEVSYKDVIENRHREKKGFDKVEMTCKIAASEGIEWVWVDTCCIDKSSSAELTEAINSMYRWYQRSKTCYAYLSDLDDMRAIQHGLPKCRWFTRGWTLQELIAPNDVIFYDKRWNSRGSKLNHAALLEHITGIRNSILTDRQSLVVIAVAEKMSWAAYRETTRIEDTAYCLMGLFNVNMPLLYGEEEKAFRRLQEEIMKSTVDLSIFGWKLPEDTRDKRQPPGTFLSGMLASSPTAFWERGPIKWEYGQSIGDFSVTNNRIRIGNEVGLWIRRGGRKETPSYAIYVGSRGGDLDELKLIINLRKVGPNQFVRKDPWCFSEVSGVMPHLHHIGSCYLLTDLGSFMSSTWHERDAGLDNLCPMVKIKDANIEARKNVIKFELQSDMTISQAWPQSNWDDEDKVLFISRRDRDVIYGGLQLWHDIDVGDRCVLLEYVLLVVWWGDEDMQYTILDYKSHTAKIMLMKELFGLVGYNGYHSIHDLRQKEIPRLPALHYPSVGENQSVLITPVTILSDVGHDVCSGGFFSVTFDVSVSEDGDVPYVPAQKWGWG